MLDFLQEAIGDGRTVTVIIANGYHMEGRIVDVDHEYGAIIIDINGKRHMVFMSAISTII